MGTRIRGCWWRGDGVVVVEDDEHEEKEKQESHEEEENHVEGLWVGLRHLQSWRKVMSGLSSGTQQRPIPSMRHQRTMKNLPTTMMSIRMNVNSFYVNHALQSCKINILTTKS
ncbi:hypothetical protein QVD17_23035 [Tagetes erecta]|uniref:Uncharacterized protein n=1 Tax=Tagetes erecta TaxID=13708 RepID=A0AAD8NM04_TARER|nr:hypothetical protein QVD17_23035 [Tagetes erecta]